MIYASAALLMIFAICGAILAIAGFGLIIHDSFNAIQSALTTKG